MWGKIIKTTKNALMVAFRDFLKMYDEVQFKEIEFLEEFPSDQKDSRNAWVQIIDKFPQIDQHLPMIAISSASGTIKKTSFGLSAGSSCTRVNEQGKLIGAWDIGIRAQLTVSIDIGCAGHNERTNLTDALSHFILIYSEKYQNQLFPPVNSPERWKIVLPNQVDHGGESEIPRSDDGVDRVYISSLSFQIDFEDWITREIEPLKMGSLTGSAHQITQGVFFAEDTKFSFKVGEVYNYNEKVTQGTDIIWELPPTPANEKDLATIEQDGTFTALFPGKIQLKATDHLNGNVSVLNITITGESV
jgi:hypothetical protein